MSCSSCILASDPVVEVVTEEGEPDTHQQSSHNRDADIAVNLRGRRCCRRDSGGHQLASA